MEWEIIFKYKSMEEKYIKQFKELDYAYSEYRFYKILLGAGLSMFILYFFIWVLDFYNVQITIYLDILLFIIIIIAYPVYFRRLLSNEMYKDTIAIYDYFIWKIPETDSIETILLKANILHSTLEKNWTSRTTERLNIANTNIIYNILTDIRSDLDSRLTEQQQVLLWARYSLTKNVEWTIELDSISELQKARLDRQIEQFEELQRTLVKI